MTLNGVPSALKHETVWLDAYKYHDAEKQYYERLGSSAKQPCVKSQNSTSEGKTKSSIALIIANAREQIQKLIPKDGSVECTPALIYEKVRQMEEENRIIHERMTEMSAKIMSLEKILSGMKISNKEDLTSVKSTAPVKSTTTSNQNQSTNDDDDLDLFGSDEETEEEARIKEERLQAYAAKKAKKPALVAKSSVVLDVKPWDDEIDMKELEKEVRKIETDGLKWGASKLVPVAFGVKKLQIIAIVEDDKVSIEWLSELIQENEDYVQSVDIAAFNKL